MISYKTVHKIIIKSGCVFSLLIAKNIKITLLPYSIRSNRSRVDSEPESEYILKIFRTTELAHV